MAMATTDHTDTTEDTMARDPLMHLQLQDQMLMPRPMLMLGTDTTVTDHGDMLDTTDHMDTGDTMARDPLMRPLPQVPTLMLIQRLIPTTGDGDTEDTMDTHTMAMDTGERSKSQPSI